MIYWVFGASLCGGASMGGSLNGYAFIFYFFFLLWKDF